MIADRAFLIYDILKHIAVLDEIGGRDKKWTKEINVVAWNGGKPKIDVRDWDGATCFSTIAR